MAFDPHTNLSYGLIDTAPSPALSGTSLTLQFGQGAFFDDPGVVGAYNVTAWPADNQPLQTNAEILRVTARVGDVFTVVRAQEGTPARAIASGWAFAQTITAKVITDIENAIPSTAGLLSAIKVSAGTTSNNLSALTFSNGNGVSFGLDGSTLTATVATNYQSSGAYLTTAGLSQDSSKYAGTNGAITGGSITVNTSGVSVNLPAYLTTAALSQDSSRYAGTNGAITNGSITVNTSGVSVNVPTQTVQTQNLVAVSLSGNTSGALALLSSGTVILAGGNNITLSQNGQSVTISAANAGGAQTAISGIAGSNTTYTSGTVIFTGVGGGITVSSNTGQRLDFSVGPYITTGRASTDAVGLNTAQTNVTWSVNSSGISINAGGYAGTGFTSTTTAGTQVKATNNTAGLSMAVPAMLTTAMASNASTQFVQANAAFAGTNASGTIASSGISVSVAATVAQSNQTIGLYASSNTTLTSSGTLDARSFSVRAIGSLTAGYSAGELLLSAANALTTQTVQTQNLVAVSLSGNTAGVLALVSSGTVVFAGGNNITVSQNGQSVTISGANLGGAQTGISGIIVSDATYTSGTVSFSNAGNITISSSVNGATQYIRLSGNAAQTAQTQSLIQAVYDGANSITTGTIRFTNANGVSFSVNGQTLSGSVATTYLASNASTNYVQANAAFAGTNASGTIASSGISVSVAAPGGTSWTVSDAASSATVARLAFTNLNGVTLSLSTGAAGSHTIVGSHNAITSQSTQFLALTLGGNTAGTTTFHATNNASLFLNGGQGITLSGNGSTVTFSVGSYITTGMLSNAATISNVRVSAGTTSNLLSAVTFADGGGVSFGLNASTITATIATSLTNIRVSAGTTSNLLSALTFSDVNGISFGLNASTLTASHNGITSQTNQTIGGYAVGNTTGQSSSSTFDARTVSFNGAGNVSVGYSGGSVVISGGSAAPSPVNFSAGTTSGNLGSVVFSDSNGISFGLNGSTITGTVSTYSTVGTATTVYPVASGNSVGTITRWAAEDHRHAGIGGIGISTGNTSGTSGSVIGTYWFAGSNNISVSQITSNNGHNTLNIIGPALASQFDPFQGVQPVSNSTLGQSTVYIVPFDVFHNVSASRINFFLSLTHTYSGAPNNSTAWLALGYALYTRGAGANSDRISTVTSYSLSYVSMSVSSSTRLSVTNYIGLSNATSHSTSQYGVNNASVSDYLGSSIAGFRVLALPMNLTLTPGRYWLAMSNQSASQGASAILGHTVMQQQLSNNLAFRVFGTASAASNASVWGMSDGVGTYSAQTAAFPDTIPLTASAIKGGPIVTFPYFNFSGIGTSNVIL